MRAKKKKGQKELFRVPLSGLLNPHHPLYRLAESIDWPALEEKFGSIYSVSLGRPAKPTRLLFGLHLLKTGFHFSDNDIVIKWMENPYWQYFCGYEYLEHEPPADPSLLAKWRARVKKAGKKQLLEETAEAIISRHSLAPKSPAELKY